MSPGNVGRSLGEKLCIIQMLVPILKSGRVTKAMGPDFGGTVFS